MNAKILIVSTFAAATLWGQGAITDRRSATIRGGGGEGKCTIEVVVDDVADVEILGPNAVIRTLSGSPSTFRRFECNQPMPENPGAFRFEGVDGRGSQELSRPPVGSGPAVIRIVDSKGGNEGYTFDIFWNGTGGPGGFGGRGKGFGRGNGGFGGDGSGFGDDSSGFGGRWNGWGNGSGWGNQGDVNYYGGRRGAGTFRNLNGQRKRLDFANVSINNSGNVAVFFEGESGRIEFTGRITSRSNRRVYANVSGGGRTGVMVFDMNARDRISRISMGTWDLNWSN